MTRSSWLDHSVADSVTCLMVFVVTVMSTMGYENDDAMYKLAVVLCTLIQVFHAGDAKWSLRDIFLSMIILAGGVLSLFITKTATLLLTAILLVSSHEVRVELLLKSFLSAKVIGLVLLFLFGLIGVFDVTTVEHFKFSVGETYTRVRINGASTNVVHLSFATAVVLLLYFELGRVRLSHFILICGLNLVLYYGITRSYMGLVMTFFVVVAGLLLTYREGFGRVMTRWFGLLLPVCLLFSFATGLLYTHVGLMDKLDALMQGRIYYNHMFLTEYSLTPFGVDASVLHGNLDNSYITVLYKFGVLPFIALFGFMAHASILLARKGDARDLLVVGFFIIAGLSESFYASAAVNASLYLVLPYLFDSSVQGNILGKHAKEDAECMAPRFLS